MTATLAADLGPQPAPAEVAELPAGVLRRMTDAVLPHAAREAYMAALCAVQWEIRGGALWLAATDTHTIGAARWPLPDRTAGVAGPVMVPVSETAALARFAGTGQAPVTVEVGAAAVTVARGDGTIRRAQGQLPVPGPGDMPDWRGVLSGLLDGTAGLPSSRIMFDSAYLSRFTRQSARAASASGGWPAQLRFQLRRHLHTRALLFLVTCEDWFIGAIRPAVTSGQYGETVADAMIREWPGRLAAGRRQG